MPPKREVTGQSVYPVKVSENGRYFTDQKNKPIFWLGDTQWELFRSFTLVQARTIITNRKRKGFSFIQIKFFGGGSGLGLNVNGDSPWKDIRTLIPNEAYFKHIDAIVNIARQVGMVLLIAIFHQRYRKHMTLDKAHAFGLWMAKRYGRQPHIVWSTTPEGTEEFIPILRRFAAGLKEGDAGTHLISCKPDPSPFTSSFLHQESWLDFNSMQTWKDVQLIYPMVSADYNLTPVKPVLMAEGAYEVGTEYGFDVTPLWVRRQAYYSYFAGAHHTYGHNDMWRVLITWKKSLDAPGAEQMGILKKIFTGRKQWWLLTPDQSVLAKGGVTGGQLLNLGARHEEGRWIMAYLSKPGTVTVRLNKLKNVRNASAKWIDPRTGTNSQIGRVPAAGTRAFSTPGGWEDAVLVME